MLMALRAFLYNAGLFTYGLILSNFFEVLGANVGLYLAVFAVGNFTGLLLLGHLFDRLGCRSMISGCYGPLFGYGIAAVLIIGVAIVELILGVRAEPRSLEDVATPLTAIQEGTGTSA